MRHPTNLHAGDFAWTKVRVLVFSLDDGFRFLARQTFRKLNVREVLSTSVAADATSMMGQVPDIGLVDVDGDAAMALAFLERVRKADPDMPVLMVAKPDDRGLVMQAVPLGIEGFLPKPVSGHELSLRVAETIKAPKRIAAPSAPPPAQGEAGGGEVKVVIEHTGGARPPPRPSPGGAGGGGAVAAGKRPGAGTYGGAEAAPQPSPAKAAGFDADDLAPAPKNSRREQIAATLPEALRPKRKADEAARAAWQEELAKSGHTERPPGKDVAALDVDAIVAAHVQWLTTQGAEGKRALFQKMDLAGADLARTVLANAGFREADLSDASLAEARLDGADFRYAVLGAADLSGANLGVAQLRHADLRLANLQGASLRGADLSGARLGGAKLAGADLKGATLVGTDLAEADLSQVENLAQGQLDKARLDMRTKLPPGVMRPAREAD